VVGGACRKYPGALQPEFSYWRGPMPRQNRVHPT
jgi:hypothetical protein